MKYPLIIKNNLELQLAHETMRLEQDKANYQRKLKEIERIKRSYDNYSGGTMALKGG